MSVLKQKRTTSKAEFINTANQIYVETLNFLTRLSARYSRLLAEPVAKLAGEIIDHAEKANSIFPSDIQRVEMRKAHLLEARASLMALDVRLTHCYLICNQNPEGCFTTAAGKCTDQGAKKGPPCRAGRAAFSDSYSCSGASLGFIPFAAALKNSKTE